MPEIKIKVRDKCAEGEGVIICNNSDYTVVWDLDGEWTPYDTKTMRVNLADGTYQDVVFTGNAAALPVLTASGWVSVGLYAGDIHTSRAARLLALSSVLTPGGSPAAPAEDVYAQIMAKLNELSTVSPEDIAKAVEDYLTEHPAASASMRVEGGYIQFSGDGKTWENVIALADLKGPKGDAGAGMDVTGATVGQIAKIAAVDDKGVPTAWEPVDFACGRGWVQICDVTITETDPHVSQFAVTTLPDGTPLEGMGLKEVIFAGALQIAEDSSYLYGTFLVNNKSIIVGQNFGVTKNSLRWFRGSFSLLGDGHVSATWADGSSSGDKTSGGGVTINPHYYGPNSPDIADNYTDAEISSIQIHGPKATSGADDNIKALRLVMYAR